MFLTEYDQDKVLEQERRDSLKQGVKQGVKQANERVAKDMLMEKLPLSLIAKISQLSEETIRSLADRLGIKISN